jgi:hypothetical protein
LFGATAGNQNIANGFYTLFSTAETFTSDAIASTPIHRSGSFKNLRVKALAATTATITIIVNGSPTSVSCSLVSATSCSNTVSSANITLGQTVSVQASGVGGGKPIVWSIEFQ